MQYMRFRKQEHDDFYDPEADTRRVIPLLVSAGLLSINVVPGTPADHELQRMMTDIMTFYRIRLVEEKQPVDRVISRFYEQFQGFDPKMRAFFCENFFLAAMIFYGILTRREAANDPKLVAGAMDAVPDILLLSMLSRDLQKSVVAELTRVHAARAQAILTPATRETIVGLLCDEQGNGTVTIDDMKDWVSGHFRMSDGDCSWDNVSAFLDRTLKSSPEADEETKFCLEQTYPGYTNSNKDKGRDNKKGVLGWLKRLFR